jgi:2-haloacid dehalogenase
MPSILVFDIGQVLIHWDPHLPYQALIPDKREREAFFSDILPPEWNLEQDRGRPWRDAEAERIALFPEKADLIRAYRAQWRRMVPHALEANVAVLRAARRKSIPCYAITNFASDTFAEAQEIYPFLTGFDGIVVSGDEKIIKPDPVIFRRFLDRYALEARDCLFMDDSAKNIGAANSLGFVTIHVTPETDLGGEVRLHGFEI